MKTIKKNPSDLARKIRGPKALGARRQTRKVQTKNSDERLSSLTGTHQNTGGPLPLRRRERSGAPPSA